MSIWINSLRQFQVEIHGQDGKTLAQKAGGQKKSHFYYSGITGEFICLLVSGIQAFQLALIDHNQGS